MYRDEAEIRRAARRAWGLYLLLLTAWVVAVLLLVLLGFLICSSVTWYSTNPLYDLLNWVRDYIVFVCLATVLTGWVVISYLFIGRLVRDTQMVLAGAEQLAQLRAFAAAGQVIRCAYEMDEGSFLYLQEKLNRLRERKIG